MNVTIVLLLHNKSAELLTSTVDVNNAVDDVADDQYYYNSATESEAKPRYLLFSCVMILSAVVSFIQIIATIYCPHLADLPIRWHTLNCSCWNVFQLLIFANCASESSFHDFLNNKYITTNCLNIQRMTLSIFYSSMILQIPATLLLHFVPNVASTRLFKFYTWIPLYFFLDLGTFMVYGSNPWSWQSVNEKLIPIQVYQAVITTLSYFSLAILILGVIAGITQFIVYFCQYMGRPDSKNSSKFVNLINLLLFLVYTLLILFVHAPANSLNMGTFLTPYVYEYVLPYLDYLIKVGLTLLQLNELTSLLIPVVEFVMTWICISTYRMQLLHCFSCGQSLQKPKPILRAMVPFQSESLAKVAPSIPNTEQHSSIPSY